MRTRTAVSAGLVAAAGAGFWAVSGPVADPGGPPAVAPRVAGGRLHPGTPAASPEAVPGDPGPGAACTLHGIALNPDGTPWEGLVGTYPPEGRVGPSALEPTGTDGRFSLPVPARGEVRLRAVLPGEREVVGPVVLLPADEEVIFRVGNGCREVEWRVLEGDSDRPVPGARIEVRYGARGRPDGRESALSDAAGRFRLRVPRRVDVAVDAVAEGFAPWQDHSGGFGEPGRPEIRMRRPATIAGRVLERGSRLPVAGVRVGVTWGGSPDASVVALTDVAGRFTLAGLPPDRHLLVAAGEGWVSVFETEVDVADGEAAKPDVLVVPAVRLRCRVLGPGGAAAPGVTVRARIGGGESYVHCRVQSALGVLGLLEGVSGASGELAFPALTAGDDWELVASREGVPLALAGPFRETGGAEVEALLSVPDRRRLGVRVLDRETGTPLEGVVLRLATEDSSDLRWYAEGGPTDPKGGAFIDPAPGVPFRVGIASPALWRDGEVEADPCDPGPVVLRVPSSRRGDLSVEGRVVQEDGTPVPDAEWSLSGPPGKNLARGFTDERGRFRASGLVEGAWKVEAEAEVDGCTLKGEVEVRSGDRAAGVELRTEVCQVVEEAVQEEPILLRIRVVGPDGVPVPRADVNWRVKAPAEDGGCSWFWGSGIEEGRGRQSVSTDFSGGEVCVWIRDARDSEERSLGLSNAFAGPFPVGAGEVEVRLVPEVTVAGRVVDDAGRPVEGATVTCGPSGDGQPVPPSSSADTDSEGAFRVRGLVAGPQVLRVSASRAGCVDPPPVTVEAGARNIEIRVRRTVSAAVRVVDPTGEPVARAVVEVGPEDGEAVRFRRRRTEPEAVRTDAHGAASFRGLDGEKGYHLRVHPPPDRPDLVEADLARWIPSNAEVLLDPGRILVVRVLDAAGLPLQGVDGTASPAAGGKTTPFRTGNDGRARLRNLPRGPVRVALADGFGLESTVPPEAGEAELRLPGAK